MTKEDVMQSISLKKRFCKDNNLPISVYDNPYFYERIKIIDQVIPCIEKFEQFCNELADFNCDQDYFEYYNSVKEAAINYIKGNADFLEFNSRVIVNQSNIGKKQLYIDENDKKVFISLDMKKANFSALYLYNSNIFGGAKTWEEFISKFTDSKHIINSKYIRQVIMGACNPKKQIQQEKELMSLLLIKMITKFNLSYPGYLCSKIKVYSLGEDEIILEIIDRNMLSSYLEIIKEFIESTNYKDVIRISAFTLEKLHGTDGWVRHIMTKNGSKVEFKCLSAEIYHQIVKHWFGQQISNDDLVFYHSGQLVQFLSPVDNPFR